MVHTHPRADATTFVQPAATDGGDAGAPVHITLDLSRTLSRLLHATPTGVDRVEMAYARKLLDIAPDRLSFAALHPAGWHTRLSTSAVRRLLDRTAERWETQRERGSRGRAWWGGLNAGLALLPSLSPDLSPSPAQRRATSRRVYLHLSARGLERRATIEAALRRDKARLVAFVHDVIPLDHPEYARPGGAALYRRKLATVRALAAGVLVNSDATAHALSPHLLDAGGTIPVQVAPLAVTQTPTTLRRRPDTPPERPYFVVLGTIEPRKNHLLLLNLWRRLGETLGPDRAPRLIVIGRRGWENENVLDLLERSTLLRAIVEERPRLSDAAVRGVLVGARALLFPSFAEGYGLPVAEALAQNVPVIASDLPALRQAGGDAPDYLDPLDGAAWMQAVLEYASPVSHRRSAQFARLAHWSPPRWDDHIAGALAFIERVAT